jgi:hypothetical protein
MTNKSLKSLVEFAPHLLTQWHPKRNGKLTPEQVSEGFGKKIWWKCTKGADHEWEARLAERLRGRGCPFCAGKKVSKINSLKSNFPSIAKEWHPTLNTIEPAGVTFGSTTLIWWKCRKGPDHEWQASPNSRTNMKSGCPFCAGQKASITNNLANLFPNIAKDWHPIKNGNLTPKDVVAGSHKKVWWRCQKGSDHEWKAPLADRIDGHGCPFCAGKKISITNSLASLYPDISDEWHPKLNGARNPRNVFSMSGQSFWWQCKNNRLHKWKASPSNRCGLGHGCPYCAESGFKKNEPAILYYIKIETGLKQPIYKIGVTNRTVSKRYVGDMGKIKIIKTWSFEVGSDALSRETEIIKQYRRHRYKGSPVFIKTGTKEMFNHDVLEIDKDN